MSARDTAVRLITKAGILFGALFLVGVLLAAIPAHKLQPQPSSAQESQSTQTNDERIAKVGALHDSPGGVQRDNKVPMKITQ
ncbi:MAG: hypothetical protein QOJ41_141 [Acidobacteriaceae bacterium]|jgi:hypothetical protein|nr:hypothetical protein [Acidobacteriaceae bacterium]